jgi:hypothetical protein
VFSVSHHPLAVMRPDLLAPAPSAMLSASSTFVQNKVAAVAGAVDVDDAAAAMHPQPFHEGLSSWNAIPVDEAPPPTEPNAIGDGKCDTAVSKPGRSAMAMDADNVAEQIF